MTNTPPSRRTGEGAPIAAPATDADTVSLRSVATSARQHLRRLVGCWRGVVGPSYYIH